MGQSKQFFQPSLSSSNNFGPAKTIQSFQPAENFGSFRQQTAQPILFTQTQSSNSFGSNQNIVQPAQQQTDSYGSSQTVIQSDQPQSNAYESNQVQVQPVQVQQTDSYGTNQVIEQPVQQVSTQSNNYGSNQVVEQPVQQVFTQSNNYGSNQNVVQTVPSVSQTNSYGSNQFVQPVRQFSPQSSGYGGQQPVSQDLSNPCSVNPCKNEGICTTSSNGGFLCQCPWGWTGSVCEICLTECASNPCPANKRCKAIYGGGFLCVCPVEMTGSNCEIRNDICSTNPCINGGECAPAEGGSFRCNCPSPWTGQICEKVWQNPCTEEVLRESSYHQFPDPTSSTNYIICTAPGKYLSMPCSVGTHFNQNLNHCVPLGFDISSCPLDYCANGAECIVDGYSALKCVCKKGFTGDRCEENIDECQLGGNQACAGGQCYDQINGYYCQCSNGIGLNCAQTIANPCTAQNIQSGFNYFEVPSNEQNTYLHCTGELTFAVIKCANNLFWHQEEKTCTIERPALRSGACSNSPCRNGGSCQEIDGLSLSSGYGGALGQSASVSCLCKNGYTGQFCEEIIDLCLSDPCKNGGRCLSYAGGYTCVCPDKIIDDCCCNGVVNPCPPKTKVIPGVNNYFAHLFPNKYIHCDFDGRAFVRNCASGTRWNQELYVCTSTNDEVTQATLTQQPINNYGQNLQPVLSQPIQTVRPILTQPILAQPSAYGANQVAAPVQIVNQQPNEYSSSQAIVQPIQQQQTDSYGSSQQQTIVEPVQQTDSYGSNQVVQPVQQTDSYGSNQVVQTVQPIQQTDSYGSNQVVQSGQQTDSYGSNQVVQPIQQTDSYGSNQVVQTVQPVQQTDSYGSNQVVQTDTFANIPQSNNFRSSQDVQVVQLPIAQSNNFGSAQNVVQQFRPTGNFVSGQTVIKPVQSIVTQPNNFGSGQFFPSVQSTLTQNSKTFGSGQVLQTVKPMMFPQQNSFAFNQPPTSFQSTKTQSGGQVFRPLSAKSVSPANVFNWYSNQA